MSVLDGNYVYDYQGKADVRAMSNFVKEKKYLELSKARHIMHATSAWDRLEHSIHEFKWSCWVIIHGLFKAAGFEHLGEDLILRIVLFMAITPLAIFVLALIYESN